MKSDPLLMLLKSILGSYVGGSSVGVVELLYGKKNVNEFLISKKLKLTINQTRNILYKLSDEGLVGFVRKKDSKKGGWYTYFWTLNVGKSLSKFRETLVNSINHVKQQIDGKKNARFYRCKNCTIDYTEEQALNNNYTCPECGEVLEVKDLTEELSGMNKELSRLENSLVRVDAELIKVQDEDNKIKMRKFRAEERKKKKDKEIRKKVLARERAKMKGKSTKTRVTRKNKGKKR